MGQPAAGRSVDTGPRRHVRFCTTASGVRIAYARTGKGPALVAPAAWISHLELDWQDPTLRAFYAPLLAHRSVIQYDGPNCGLSDPSSEAQSLEAELEVLRTVVDELGLDRFSLLGVSMGAPVALAFAAHHRDRIDRLILYGGYADGQRIASAEVRVALMDLIRANWGLGSDVLANIFLTDADAAARARFTQLQRAAASAEVACRLLARCYELRVTDLLDQVAVPTLVLHRRDDRAIPYDLGRELAARIRGAQLVTLEGRSHYPYIGDSQAIVRAILDFLGAPSSPRRTGALTSRQLEVAALVANGMTNGQIAARLGIEERSAEGHVERIRQRLGFSSRSQIAAWWAHGHK